MLTVHMILLLPPSLKGKVRSNRESGVIGAHCAPITPVLLIRVSEGAGESGVGSSILGQSLGHNQAIKLIDPAK